MLSNKLTFSLASLVVLLIVGLCLPVAVQAQTTFSIEITAPVALEPGRDADGFAADSFAIYAHSSGDTNTVTASSIGLDGPNVDQFIQELPNLQEYFNDPFSSGTLELLYAIDGADDATAVNTLTFNRHDVVISEIMWALDDAEDSDSLHYKQWIELVSTVDGSVDRDGDAANGIQPRINLSNGEWVLHFTPNKFYQPRLTVPNTEVTLADKDATGAYMVIDRVSTIYLAKWVMPGQSGRTRTGEQGGANEEFQTGDLKHLISAYRKIDVTGNWGQRGTSAEPSGFGKKAVSNGILSGGWGASPTRFNMEKEYVGSPESLYIGPTVGAEPAPKTSVMSDSVVISEIRNDTSDLNFDWVEFYNAGTTEVDLRGWELTYHNADPDPGSDGLAMKDTDIMLIGKEDGDNDSHRFPANFKLQPGAYLLVVSRDPEGKDSPLAGGINVESRNDNKDVPKGAVHQYVVRPKIGNMPDSGNFMLILRDHLEKNWSHKALDINRFHTASDNIKDYAGNYFVPNYTERPATRIPHYNTRVWPFRGWNTPGDNESIPSNTTQAWARKRYNKADDGHHKDAWDHVTGNAGNARFGVGYDPDVDLTFSPGTPGYANDLIKGRTTDNTGASAFEGMVSISEIMYDAGPRWNLIQWIELYNSSMTQAVNLKDWVLEIHNSFDPDDDGTRAYVDSSFVFKDVVIKPNQTILLVSGNGTSEDVPDNRVYSLYEHHRRELGLTNRRTLLLSRKGFSLRLTHPDPSQPNNPRAVEVVDVAGNIIDDSGKINRDNPYWDLPDRNPERRHSIVRTYGGVWSQDYDGIGNSPDSGIMVESWRISDIIGAQISYYGHADDVGTPGYRQGGPLPVSLSSFRPVRDQATGEVVVRWITQSELNNAGFNILRSEAKDGEFEVVNLKGIIPGHGTTSEKHVYEWTDTSAKPNVVYYYQIEDVSLDGNRTTLRTTHLRGNVNAAGKLTTRWGELKTYGK